MIESNLEQQTLSELISLGRVGLISLWLDQIDNQSTQPIINKEQLLQKLLSRFNNEETEPLTIIAIGCLDWQPVSWSDDPKDHIIKPIFNDNKRVQKTALSLQQLSRALDSFGVANSIFFTISDVEAILNSKLNNLWERIHNYDLLTDIETSVNTFNMALNLNDEPIIKVFRHLKTLMQLLGSVDAQTILTGILKGEKSDYDEFVQRLYQTDLDLLPSFFTHQNPENLVWLDLSHYTEGYTNIREVAATEKPNLPIMSPLHNAGNWNATPVNEPEILTKLHFVSNLVGIDYQLTFTDQGFSEQRWMQLLASVSDQQLLTALSILGIELTINSKSQKAQALNVLTQITLGKDFNFSKEERKIIALKEPLPLFKLVALMLGTRTMAEARSLIKSGQVFIQSTNGHQEKWLQVNDMTQIVTIGQTIKVGKRRTAELIEDSNTTEV